MTRALEEKLVEHRRSRFSLRNEQGCTDRTAAQWE